MKFKKRQTWKNDAKNQVSEPLRQYEPENLNDIISIIQQAEKEEVQVRAIGSGHSFSDVAVTTGFQLKPNKLTRILDLKNAALRANADTFTLLHVESGIRIRELNEELDQRGLALSNMGGYDEQTIAGVISTATHGSGIEFGPLSDIVESLELVGEGGQVYRIEPKDGLTDPSAFQQKYPERQLIQDDDWFQSVVVSMGCMGVIYSIIIRVTQKFWLKEVRKPSDWNTVKALLKQGDVLKANRHWEVLINPHKIDGKHNCLITTRNPTKKPQGLPADKLNRNLLTEFLASLTFLGKILSFVFRKKPKIADDFINDGLKALEDDSYINVSYKVFNIGHANELPVVSSEIALPLENDLYLAAVDRFLQLVEQHKTIGELYHTSPVALRFVKASKAFLSMMHDRDVCMIEIILVSDTQGALEMMHRYENELYKFSGRPHWGQVNRVNGSNGFMKSMYPAFDKWMNVYNQLNTKGTFSSPFSERVGISKHSFRSIS